MNTVVNVHDLKTHYSEYLEQVMQGGEIVLGKNGKAVAKMVPLDAALAPRKPGILKGKVWISKDFDEPLTALWDTIGKK